MTDAFERATMRKVSWRLLPLIFVLYIAAYLDRTNVGIAALQMNQDLGLSSAAYGFGAGVFFIGYGLLEVPSNLFLARVGARRWIARIAITWGIIACAMMFVRGPLSFYFLRFLLGAAEAGCFPGIVFYLSHWFPERQRASAISRFMASVPIAGMIGGPLGGWLLSLRGEMGLAGWQWLYLVEGIPSIILGVAVLIWVTDRPEDATWLTTEEREWLTSKLESERGARAHMTEASTRRGLTSGAVWWLAGVYFLGLVSYLGPVFFGPVLVADAMHVSSMQVGWIIGAIGFVGMIGMLANGAHSDATQERVWHVAAALLVTSVGYAICTFSHGVGVVLGLGLIAFAGNAFLPPFWCVPPLLLRGTAAAGGIALINSIGNLGGFVGPNIFGFGKSMTGSFTGGFIVLGSFAIASALMILAMRRAPALAQPAPVLGQHG